MNYITEVTAFFDWVPDVELNTDAQALWHALMHFNNKCAIKVDGVWYWRYRFKAPTKKLLSILPFSDVQLSRMRRELIDKERIVYKRGSGNQSGKYTLIPFDQHYVRQTVSYTVNQIVGQKEIEVWGNPLPLIINNNTGNSNNSYHHPPHPREREEAGPEQTADALIQKHFMRPAYPVEVEYLAQQLNKREASLIEEALKIACSAGQPNLNYLKGIFKNFTANGIRTEDEYWGHEAVRDITSWEKGGRS